MTKPLLNDLPGKSLYQKGGRARKCKKIINTNFQLHNCRNSFSIFGPDECISYLISWLPSYTTLLMRAFRWSKTVFGEILITEIFFLKSIINSSEMRIFHYSGATVDKQREKKSRRWRFPVANRRDCRLVNVLMEINRKLLGKCANSNELQTKIV